MQFSQMNGYERSNNTKAGDVYAGSIFKELYRFYFSGGSAAEGGCDLCAGERMAADGAPGGRTLEGRNCTVDPPIGKIQYYERKVLRCPDDGGTVSGAV